MRKLGGACQILAVAGDRVYTTFELGSYIMLAEAATPAGCTNKSCSQRKSGTIAAADSVGGSPRMLSFHRHHEYSNPRARC